MKLSPDSTGRDISGRMDHQEFPERDSSAREVNADHLNEMRQRLLMEPKALNETFTSWAVETHSFLSGTRGIGRWTHQHKETVQQMAAPEGGVSDFKFLYTARRGTASTNPEEREDMVLRFNSLAGRSWSWGSDGYRLFAAQYLSKISIPHTLTPWTEEILDNPQRGNGRETTGIQELGADLLDKAHERISRLNTWSPLTWEGNVLRVLDPANDLWLDDNSTEWSLGRHAWRLAVLLGLQDVLLTQKDIQTLTGLTERPVRALLARWKRWPNLLVFEAKIGRTKVYGLLFGKCLDPMGEWFDGHAYDQTRLHEAMARDKRERDNSARRGTPEGIIAWKACNPRTRQVFLDELPHDADSQWRELVAAGDELDCYAYLVEQAKEAGPVPASPEVLSGPLPVAREEMAPQVQESRLSPEEEAELDAKWLRVTGSPRSNRMLP